MASWASKNMSDGEKKAYNAAVNSKDMDTVKLAVDGLRAKYQAANGTEPNLYKVKLRQLQNKVMILGLK